MFMRKMKSVALKVLLAGLTAWPVWQPLPLLADELSAPKTVKFLGVEKAGNRAAFSDTVLAAGQTSVTLPAEAPVLNGTAFAGWKYGNVVYAPGADVPVDTTLPLTFSVVQEAETATFAVDEDTFAISPVEIDPESQTPAIVVPSEVPTKNGYAFKGWMLKGELYQPGERIILITEEAPVFHAEFTKVDTSAEPEKASSVQVSFKVDTKTIATKTCNLVSQSNGTLAYQPLTIEVEPETRDGFYFQYWADGDAHYSLGSRLNPTKDTILEAVYGRLYTVTIDIDGEKTTESSRSDYTLPSQNLPKRSGYTFAGWRVDDQVLKPGDTLSLTRDIVIQPEWSKKETSGTSVVTLLNEDGSMYLSQNVNTGSSWTLPEGPAKEGYGFSGWKNEDQLLKAGSSLKVNKDLSLKAVYGKWTNYTLEYRCGSQVVHTDTYTVAGDLNVPLAQWDASWSREPFRFWKTDSVADRHFHPGELFQTTPDTPYLVFQAVTGHAGKDEKSTSGRHSPDTGAWQMLQHFELAQAAVLLTGVSALSVLESRQADKDEKSDI